MISYELPKTWEVHILNSSPLREAWLLSITSRLGRVGSVQSLDALTCFESSCYGWEDKKVQYTPVSPNKLYIHFKNLDLQWSKFVA